MIDYTIAEEYADCVHALALTEHWGHELTQNCIYGQCPFGDNDGGQAFGLLQMHSATFKQYYGCCVRFAPSVTDTWAEAQIKACAGFLHLYYRDSMDLRIQAWNKGIHAVVDLGLRNPDYLAKYTEALNKVRGIK